MIGLPFLVCAATYTLPRYDEWRNCLNTRTQAVISIAEKILGAVQCIVECTLGDYAWQFITFICKNAWLPALALSYTLQFTTCSVYLVALIIIAGSLATSFLEIIITPSAPPLPQELIEVIYHLQVATKALQERESLHPQDILKTHTAAILESLAALAPQLYSHPYYLKARKDLLEATVDSIRCAGLETHSPTSQSKRTLQDIREKADYILPEFHVATQSPLIKKTQKLVVEWFSRFPNSKQIIHTLDRQDLEGMHLNGKALHREIKAYKAIRRICRDDAFLKHAKVALLAEAVAASFSSSNLESNKNKAANLVALMPIEANPVTEFAQSFCSLLPYLYREDLKNAPVCTNALRQPSVSFHIATASCLELKAHMNFVISQLEESEIRELIEFSQTAELSRKFRGRIFKGQVTIAAPLQ